MTSPPLETPATRINPHCAYCGHPIPDATEAPERFGERFCSEAHADEFAAGVRSARIEAAARAEARAEAVSNGASQAASHGQPAGQQKKSWTDQLTRWACWGAPVLLLLALPLLWSGNGLAAAGGSLLGVLALLACPLGMFFMMRAMGNMQRGSGSEQPSGRGRETKRSPGEGERR
ncbi:MAG: DUF2933 domain-containing protein [Candidatus Rokuibacteriota bacterium]